MDSNASNATAIPLTTARVGNRHASVVDGEEQPLNKVKNPLPFLLLLLFRLLTILEAEVRTSQHR